jgi:adenylylsulfate kinase
MYIKPIVIWFTGLPAAGKSTLAYHLDHRLKDLGCRTFIIDGDVLRKNMGNDLSFSNEDRSKNVVRAIDLASTKLNEGYTVIVALISPFIKDRELARSIINPSRFLEIYVDTPLAECEKRDPKGLYKKSRQGLIDLMTGIDSPYEVPTNPGITIHTLDESIEESIRHIISRLVLN